MRARFLKLIIEQMRQELYKITQGKKFTDPEVIAASQRLDKVLNVYQLLVKKESQPRRARSGKTDNSRATFSTTSSQFPGLV